MQEFFDNALVSIGEFFTNLWAKLVELYAMYSDFVHSIFPDKLGDYFVYLIDLAVIVLIVWLVAKAAFRTRGN